MHRFLGAARFAPSGHCVVRAPALDMGRGPGLFSPGGPPPVPDAEGGHLDASRPATATANATATATAAAAALVFVVVVVVGVVEAGDAAPAVGGRAVVDRPVQEGLDPAPVREVAAPPRQADGEEVAQDYDGQDPATARGRVQDARGGAEAEKVGEGQEDGGPGPVRQPELQSHPLPLVLVVEHPGVRVGRSRRVDVDRVLGPVEELPQHLLVDDQLLADDGGSGPRSSGAWGARVVLDRDVAVVAAGEDVPEGIEHPPPPGADDGPGSAVPQQDVAPDLGLEARHEEERVEDHRPAHQAGQEGVGDQRPQGPDQGAGAGAAAGAAAAAAAAAIGGHCVVAVLPGRVRAGGRGGSEPRERQEAGRPAAVAVAVAVPRGGRGGGGWLPHGHAHGHGRGGSLCRQWRHLSSAYELVDYS